MIRQAPRVRRVPIGGIETGITGTDECIAAVKALDPVGDAAVTEELLARLAKGNYIPTKKRAVYGPALFAEIRRAGWVRPGLECSCPLPSRREELHAGTGRAISSRGPIRYINWYIS